MGAPDELAARLADEYRDRLRFFAARALHDVAAAEDVAQETLRIAVDALRSGRVDNLAAMPGFVYETARHLCQHRVRSMVRERRALGRFGRGLEDRDPNPDALSLLVSAERRRTVQAALAALAAEDRRLLESLFAEETPAADLAQRLGIQAGALRARKHRALKRLAALLAPGNAAAAAGTS